jgi:hypothetical protein
MPKESLNLDISDGQLHRVLRRLLHNAFYEPEMIDHVEECFVKPSDFRIEGLRVFLKGEEIPNIKAIHCDMNEPRIMMVDYWDGQKTNTTYNIRKRIHIDYE